MRGIRKSYTHGLGSANIEPRQRFCSADITPNVFSWSTIESANAPQGTAIAGGGIDDNVRAIQAGVKRAVANIGADMTASSTVDLSGATGNTVNILGAGSSVSSLGSVASGAVFTLIFAGANTLVHSANLVLPGRTNISVSAGDVFQFTSRGSGAWTCTGATPNIAPGGLPIGSPIAWLASSVPTGYLLCAGQVVNRTIYSALFSVLGTTYNSGGEAGTDFRLPDLRGRFLAGLDNMGGTAAGRIGTYALATAVGQVGGSEEPHMHSHTASSASALTTHSHSQTGSVSGTTGVTDTNHYHSFSGSGNTGTESETHTHGYNAVQGVSTVVGFGSGFDSQAAQTGTESATHYHGFSFSGNTAYQSDTGFGNYQHSHSFSASISGSTETADLAHTHGITVNQTGIGTQGNLPPVMFINWIIRAY